ncbi:Imm1 family immunity protein [Amycolatopsis sp. NPDC059021]|uniref:Imm1 family immunity protein n=1 Tax=Amycolatopsis sp. NPDC059021 TaxID=3346704 RepID=UPI00366D176E
MSRTTRCGRSTSRMELSGHGSTTVMPPAGLICHRPWPVRIRPGALLIRIHRPYGRVRCRTASGACGGGLDDPAGHIDGENVVVSTADEADQLVERLRSPRAGIAKVWGPDIRQDVWTGQLLHVGVHGSFAYISYTSDSVGVDLSLLAAPRGYL